MMVASPLGAPWTLPLNYEAEQALIGALVMNARKLDLVIDYLRPDHFADPVHQMLYQTILSMADQNCRIDLITVKNRTSDDEGLKELGGDSYLARLAAAAQPFGVNAYGRLIFDLAQRRELIGIAEDMVLNARDLSDVEKTATHIQENAEAKLFALSAFGPTQNGPKSFSACFDDALSGIEAACASDGRLQGIATGLSDLDQMLGGFRASDLIILGGRPSMGKTALATGMALAAARSGKKTLVFSLEMSAEQLTNRIISAEIGLSSNRLEQGWISRAEFERIAIEIRENIAGLPLFIDDQPALTIEAIRTRARRLARSGGLGMIVIDYLQLIGQGGKRAENRTQEISEFTRKLKALAKDLNIPVLVLSQLSRALEAREDKRPQLSDLRESGSIEQDADVVMFVYRDQYYLERAEPDAMSDRHQKWKDRHDRSINQADIIIAKQRRGPIGSVQVFFNPELTLFRGLAKRSGA